MGSCISQSPIINHSALRNYCGLMKLQHPFNINKKYTHISKIYSNEFVGTGLRKTNAYICKISPGEFYSKRDEFWETRTSGNLQVWKLIRQTLDYQNDDDIKVVLEAEGVKPLNNSIQLCIDQSFNKYELPIYCINMPQSFDAADPAQRSIKPQYAPKQIQFKLRAPKIGSDLEFCLSNTIKIDELKRIFRRRAQISDHCRIKLFYSGKEALDQYSVGNYGLREEDVITAVVQDC